MKSSIWAAATSACVLLLATPALAGPPYLTDDPDPTPHKGYEILFFAAGDRNHGDFEGDAGLDFNYGGGPDLQLTATIPISYADPKVGPSTRNIGDIELAAKYRFVIQEDGAAFSVAVFPRVIVPAGPGAGGRNTQLLLPVWVGREGEGWNVFGGGGCALNSSGTGRNYCLGGAAFTRQVAENLTLGVEAFRQGAEDKGGLASTTVGLGATLDLSERFHILGWVGQGVEHPDQTGRTSGYASILLTF